MHVASSQAWKLRDCSPGCLFSILIVMAFPQHATHLVVPRWLPQPRLVLLWPDQGEEEQGP